MKWILVLALVWLAWRYLRPKPKRVTPPADPRRDARRVLGVGPDASDDEIRAAHRRLVADVHPDRGGSAERTRAVNAARDVLLGRA